MPIFTNRASPPHERHAGRVGAPAESHMVRPQPVVLVFDPFDLACAVGDPSPASAGCT